MSRPPRRSLTVSLTFDCLREAHASFSERPINYKRLTSRRSRVDLSFSKRKGELSPGAPPAYVRGPPRSVSRGGPFRVGGRRVEPSLFSFNAPRAGPLTREVGE